MKETNRLYGVLDRRLSDREFVARADYSIADMASYPRILPEAQGQDLGELLNLARWHAAIKARLATERAYAVSPPSLPRPFMPGLSTHVSQTHRVLRKRLSTGSG